MGVAVGSIQDTLAQGKWAQDKIAQVRDQLLGGLGPGASEAELNRNMHRPAQLIGEPMARHREAVARQNRKPE